MPAHLKNTKSVQGYSPSLNGTNSINVGRQERLLSIAAGSLLAYHAVKNIKESPLLNISKLGAAAFLLYRGISANCPVKSQLGINHPASVSNDIKIHTRLTVNKPRKEIYHFWRRVGNLPIFMSHLKSVDEVNAIHSNWEAKIPGNLGTIKWQAEVVEDIPNEKISWSSVPDSVIENSGTVLFRDIHLNATELDVEIHYRPPAGKIGSSISRLFNPLFEKIIKNDIQNFKQHIETQIAEENRLTTYSRI